MRNIVVLHPDGFDYSVVKPDLAKRLRTGAARIRRQVEAQVSAIVEIGALLLDVKASLEHGLFACWVTDELPFTLRTAEKYMTAASFCSGKSELVSHLAPSDLYKLAAPSTPLEIKSRVVECLESGKCIDMRAIEAEIRTARRSMIESEGSNNGLPAPAQYEDSDARSDPLTLLREVAAILEGALSETAYRRVCVLLTSPAIIEQPARLPALLESVFAAISH